VLSYTAVGLCECVCVCVFLRETEKRNILNNVCPFAILLQGVTALHGIVTPKYRIVTLKVPMQKIKLYS
jgi:hypothetical protein